MNKKTQISLLRSMPDVCYIMRHNSDNMWIYHGVFDKIIKDIVRLVRVQKMRREILRSQQRPRFQYPSVYNQYYTNNSSVVVVAQPMPRLRRSTILLLCILSSLFCEKSYQQSRFNDLKFRPDMKTLSSAKDYAIYEVHADSLERKLDANERPLWIQFDWGKDGRDGRFLLKNENAKTVEFDTTVDGLGFLRDKKRMSKHEKKKQQKKMNHSTPKRITVIQYAKKFPYKKIY